MDVFELAGLEGDALENAREWCSKLAIVGCGWQAEAVIMLAQGYSPLTQAINAPELFAEKQRAATSAYNARRRRRYQRRSITKK